MVNAYITNEGGGISVIDTSSNTVVTTINATVDAYGVAVSSDGSKAYITNNSSGNVSVIDTSTNTVSATITVGTGPLGVAVTPDGTKAYVTNFSSNSVSVINTSTNTVSTTITGVTNPIGVAVTLDNKYAYVTAISGTNSVVVVIDTSTNTVAATITDPSFVQPYGIAMTPNGRYAYVADNSADYVFVIDTSTRAVVAAIATPNRCLAVAITPDGSFAYVTSNTNGNTSIYVIDTSSNIVAATITTSNPPYGVAITPDGKYAYVATHPASGNGSVIAINIPANTIAATITVGQAPIAFGQFMKPSTQPTESDMTTPQGRLTLSSTVPVMTADATAQATIYYLPYQGSLVPLYNGSVFVNNLMGSSGISLALDNNSSDTGYQQSGKLFDIFAFLNSGTLTLGTGPAWTNNTTRNATITQLNGIWVNSASITLRYGNASGNTVSVAANQATYLGTMYATANGQTGVQFKPAAASGGSNNVMGLYNAYNRVRFISMESDSTTSWTYATTGTWRMSNNSASNRISWVDGLAQSMVVASVQQGVSLSTAGNVVRGGPVLNSTTNNPDWQFNFEAGINGDNGFIQQRESYYPQLGFNFIQQMEEVDSGTATFYAAGNAQALMLEGEY